MGEGENKKIMQTRRQRKKRHASAKQKPAQAIGKKKQQHASWTPPPLPPKHVVTSLVTLCPYHVLTSCVHYPCTHALPHGIYLLTKQGKDLDRDSFHIDRTKRTIDPMEENRMSLLTYLWPAERMQMVQLVKIQSLPGWTGELLCTCHAWS